MPEESLFYWLVAWIGLVISATAFRKGILGLRWSILNRQGRVDARLGMLFAGCYWVLFLLSVFVGGSLDP